MPDLERNVIRWRVEQTWWFIPAGCWAQLDDGTVLIGPAFLHTPTVWREVDD